MDACSCFFKLQPAKLMVSFSSGAMMNPFYQIKRDLKGYEIIRHGIQRFYIIQNSWWPSA